MANYRTGNIWYVDTNATLTTENLRVSAIVFTATASSASVQLQDSDGNAIMDLEAANNGTAIENFAPVPLALPKGLKIASITNCTLTIITSGRQGRD